MDSHSAGCPGQQDGGWSGTDLSSWASPEAGDRLSSSRSWCPQAVRAVGCQSSSTQWDLLSYFPSPEGWDIQHPSHIPKTSSTESEDQQDCRNTLTQVMGSGSSSDSASSSLAPHRESIQKKNINCIFTCRKRNGSLQSDHCAWKLHHPICNTFWPIQKKKASQSQDWVYLWDKYMVQRRHQIFRWNLVYTALAWEQLLIQGVSNFISSRLTFQTRYYNKSMNWQANFSQYSIIQFLVSSHNVQEEE